MIRWLASDLDVSPALLRWSLAAPLGVLLLGAAIAAGWVVVG